MDGVLKFLTAVRMTGAGEETAVEVMGTQPAENAELEMSEGPAAKRVALGHATALAGLTLQLVMLHAGKNEGIFLANVCTCWKKSYISTFKDEICTPDYYKYGSTHSVCTHRAAAMMNLQRVHWVWSEWCSEKDFGSRRGDASAFLGQYAPRSVVQVAILDDALAVDCELLMRGIARSGREALLEQLWHDYKLTKASAKPKELEITLSRIANEAAENGNLRAFALVWSYLEENHGERAVAQCGEGALFESAEKGYVHILEFLSLTDWWSRGNGPCNNCNTAAIHDQTTVLSWLRAHGQVWNSSTARAAASNSETRTMDFLLQNGCPGMDKNFVSCCVQHGRGDALQWCYDTLRPRVAGLWSAVNLRRWLLLAGAFDRQKAAKFLIEHGAEWPDIGGMFGKDIACHSDDDYDYDPISTTCVWSPSFLEWAMAEGCTFGTWSTATCARLVKETEWTKAHRSRSLLETLTWAHANGCPCLCPRDKPDF